MSRILAFLTLISLAMIGAKAADESTDGQGRPQDVQVTRPGTPEAGASASTNSAAKDKAVVQDNAKQGEPVKAGYVSTQKVENTDKAVDNTFKKPDNFDADNTRRNKREADGTALTPMDQKENRADLEMTQQIRKALMDDKSLSFYGQNVKIITQDGRVTLKGPVRSAVEKQNIETMAGKIAGDEHVTSNLELAPEPVK